MSHSQYKEDESMDAIIAVLIALVLVVFVGVMALYKAVKGAPEHYKNLTFKQVVPKAGMGILLAALIEAILYRFPGFKEAVILSFRHLILRTGVIINWGLLNLVSGSVAYLTIPLWRKAVSRETLLKPKLY